MRQIKTITNRLDNATFFDDAVNRAISEGWTLTDRLISPARNQYYYTMLVAYLEKDVEEEQP